MQHNCCIACGGNLRFLFEGAAGQISQCQKKSCGLALVTNQPSDQALSDSYERLYYGAQGNNRTEQIKENSNDFKLQQHFDTLDGLIGLRGKRILDYGCGIGNFLTVARNSGAETAVGIESNDHARQQAKQRGFQVAADLNDLGSETFDFIYMNDVIEHLRDPIAVCEELRRRLTDKGKIFVATINLSGLKARIARARWDMVKDPTHLYFFNKVSLAFVLNSAGFSSPQALQFSVDFSHHGFLRRTIQRFLVRTGLGSSLKMVATNSIVDATSREST